jgi:hypothetical protein
MLAEAARGGASSRDAILPFRLSDSANTFGQDCRGDKAASRQRRTRNPPATTFCRMRNALRGQHVPASYCVLSGKYMSMGFDRSSRWKTRGSSNTQRPINIHPSILLLDWSAHE